LGGGKTQLWVPKSLWGLGCKFWIVSIRGKKCKGRNSKGPRRNIRPGQKVQFLTSKGYRDECVWGIGGGLGGGKGISKR